MNPVSYIATSLLFLLCILNLYLGIITVPDNSFIGYFLFSVVYFTIGLLIIRKFRFAELFGFLIPLGILFIYPLIVNFENMNSWLAGILGAFDAIVVICCLILGLLKIKSQ
jgi:hypothetical protein